MNIFLTKVSVFIVMAFLAGMPMVSQAGEKEKFTFTKEVAPTTLSETKMPLPDAPNHEYVQGVYSFPIKSSNPEWDGINEIGYGQVDQIAGTGRHWGIGQFFLKSGDQVWYRYQGTHKTVTKDSGAWETTFEGSADFVGGTGKYKNVNGKVTYQGKDTAEGTMEELHAEMEY
jgi:hypothetical protein